MSVKISVIMAVYNSEKTIAESIDSILNQTFSDWEFIICDDGSTDATFRIIQEYAEKYPEKFIVIRNEQNSKLPYSLNRCLEHAKGEYIARMDGDDVCSPERFEVELRCLEENPDLQIVSTDMEYFDETGVWGRISHPEYPVNMDFLAGVPFCHAACMVRREAYEAVGGYTVDKRLLRMEDYHLWVKMYAKGFKGHNIRKPLYQMRDDRDAYRRRTFRYRLNEAYVRLLLVKELKLPFYTAANALRPIIVGLLPMKVYDLLHKRKLRQ